MLAFGGTAMLFLSYALAGWMGYQIGLGCGICKERTKRGIRRWVQE